MLHIDGLVIALDAHMFSHDGYGPWPISIMAEHMCIKGNQYAINTQYTTGNFAYYM